MDDLVYVTAVKRGGENNRIEAFKLNDGRVLSFAECYQAVERGEIPSLITGATRNGEVTIRSKRGYDDYSLDSLPTF